MLRARRVVGSHEAGFVGEDHRPDAALSASFIKILLTCVLTMLSSTTSSVAISALVSPSGDQAPHVKLALPWDRWPRCRANPPA